MKKIMVALIMLCSVSFVYCKDMGAYMEKYGFVFENRKAVYYDPNIYEPVGGYVNFLIKSDNEIKSIKGEYVYARGVQFQNDMISITSVTGHEKIQKFWARKVQNNDKKIYRNAVYLSPPFLRSSLSLRR